MGNSTPNVVEHKYETPHSIVEKKIFRVVMNNETYDYDINDIKSTDIKAYHQYNTYPTCIQYRGTIYFKNNSSFQFNGARVCAPMIVNKKKYYNLSKEEMFKYVNAVSKPPAYTETTDTPSAPLVK